MVYSKGNVLAVNNFLFLLSICNHLNVGSNICLFYVFVIVLLLIFLCCHFGQDSVEEEILHLNGTILVK